MHFYNRSTRDRPGQVKKFLRNDRKIRKQFKFPPDCYILIGRKPVQVSLLHWGIWFENARNRIVKKTALPGGVEVSTVFLGLNHGYGGRLLLFETMIFAGDAGGYCDRYATYDEALAGHQKAIEEAFKVDFDNT